MQVGNSRLQLNGAGVRYKLVFKVYAAALYLGEKASTPEAVLAATGPRHLQIVMLRDIDANELGKLFTKGMEQNAAREEFSKSVPGILRMSDIFSGRKKLATGESFAVEWVPGSGHGDHGQRQARGRADQGAGVLFGADEDLARQRTRPMRS